MHDKIARMHGKTIKIAWMHECMNAWQNCMNAWNTGKSDRADHLAGRDKQYGQARWQAPEPFILVVPARPGDHWQLTNDMFTDCMVATILYLTNINTMS